MNSATSAAAETPVSYAAGRFSANTIRGQRLRPNSDGTPSAVTVMVYVAHIGGVWFLVDHPANGVGFETGWRMWGVFVVVAMAFALMWKRFLKRGPLEWVMWAAAKPAKFVK